MCERSLRKGVQQPPRASDGQEVLEAAQCFMLKSCLHPSGDFIVVPTLSPKKVPWENTSAPNLLTLENKTWVGILLISHPANPLSSWEEGKGAGLHHLISPRLNADCPLCSFTRHPHAPSGGLLSALGCDAHLICQVS